MNIRCGSVIFVASQLRQETSPMMRLTAPIATVPWTLTGATALTVVGDGSINMVKTGKETRLPVMSSYHSAPLEVAA